jgi:hypothetical protein
VCVAQAHNKKKEEKLTREEDVDYRASFNDASFGNNGLTFPAFSFFE